MRAAWQGHTDVVRELIGAGADPRLRNRNREQAETLATAAGHTHIAQMLERYAAEKWRLFALF
jgi:ankyrin repeat protein